MTNASGLSVPEKVETIEGKAYNTGVLTPLFPQEHAWTELYRTHKAELVNYIKGQWHKDEDTAQDIAHQAFERFLCLPNPSSIEKPRAYLFQLARNLLIDEHRRESVRQEHRNTVNVVQAEPDSATLELQLIHQQELDTLQHIIEQLPPKRQKAFVLSRVYQMSYREIAADMGISTEGVKKHVMRALDTCHRALKRKDDDAR